MSDTRTDREALIELAAEALRDTTYACGRVWEAWQYNTMTEDDFSPAWEDPYILANIVDTILTAGFARRIPAPSTIAVPHTPEEIWAAADVWCDLDFWNRDDLEYTPDGVLHLASNVNITPDDEHMPDHLRPDIGVDY
jgi:hypothetical protein